MCHKKTRGCSVLMGGGGRDEEKQLRNIAKLTSNATTISNSKNTDVVVNAIEIMSNELDVVLKLS